MRITIKPLDVINKKSFTEKEILKKIRLMLEYHIEKGNIYSTDNYYLVIGINDKNAPKENYK